jgi:hypothetical protein
MIDISEPLFLALKAALIEQFPFAAKGTGGTGFYDSTSTKEGNVLDYEPKSAERDPPYDFVIFRLVNSAQGQTTIASAAERFATLTYQVDIYALNGGTDAAGSTRIAAKNRAHETLKAVNEVMNAKGLTRFSFMQDSNHMGKDIYRIAVTYRALYGNSNKI